MQWSEDVGAGDWLRERLDDPWRGTMHDVAPRGYPAYARIPHADGREGRLEPETLARVVTTASAFTTTPDVAWIAIWDGWGGVLGFYGETPARAFLALDGHDDADAAVEARHRQMLARSISDPFNKVFRRPVWQPGILSDEISRGPRLELPNRDHVLFRGALAELSDADWPARVPWAEQIADWTASPSLVWPDDRAWVLATDVDATATIVAGPEELVLALSPGGRPSAG